MRNSKKQLKKQFFIAFIFIFIVTLLAFMAFIRPLNEKINNKVFSYIDFSVKSFMTLSSNAIANDLILNQYESLEGTAQELSLIKGVKYIGVFDKKDKVIYQNLKQSLKNIKFFNEKKDSFVKSFIFKYQSEDVVAFKYDINAIGKKLGSVKLYYSVSDFVLLMSDIKLYVNIFIFIFIFVMFFSISILLNKLVLSPISKISEEIEDIYNEHKRTDIKIESYNEIGEMASAFNHLSSRNENMFKELEKNNSTLEETV